MKQFQLILLLLLTNSHIPKSIVDYLTGMKTTTCSLNFIPFKDIPKVKDFLNWFSSDLLYSDLENFGIFSGSTLINNFSLLWVFGLIITSHLILNLLFKYIKFDRQRWPKLTKFYDKIYQLFAFTIYIRLMLEASQFMMLSSFQELKVWNVSNTSKTISLIIAFITAIFWISFIIISIIHWFYNRKIDSIDHYMPLKEFFCDLKDKYWPRLYLTILMLRRSIFASILIVGEKASSIGLVIPLIVLQALYLAQLLIIRPFKQAGDNLLEITNELFYLVLIVLLAHFNSESNWNNTAGSIYLFLIIANSLWSALLIICKINN